ncbi:amidohydrolase family protein [Hoeflea sp. CAU 1731]
MTAKRQIVTPGYLPFDPDPGKPQIVLPEGACDSHCHVFGPANRFPYASTSSYVPVDAPAELLFRLHDHLGFERCVIVQASCHSADNSALVDALRKAGNKARGVAVVDPATGVDELEMLHEAGVRGVRFNFVKRLKALQPLKDRLKIVEKIAPLGWHVVVYCEPDSIDAVRLLIETVETPVVIDHMGRVPVEKGVDSPEYQTLEQLLTSSDRLWIKVSCPERLSRQGPPYIDVDAVSKRLIEVFADRVLFGADWPHPNMVSHMPDDGLLVDRIARICPNVTVRRKMLVDNPTCLYWN